jgi:hypothetical protein
MASSVGTAKSGVPMKAMRMWRPLADPSRNGEEFTAARFTPT